MKVVITRPEPDASRLSARLASLGHEPVLCPLMTIRFHTNKRPSSSRYQAILVTSANGLRALEATGVSKGLKAIPVVAVGPASARLAASLGYVLVHEAAGDVTSLANMVVEQMTPGDGPLLYVTGTSRTGDLKADLEQHGYEVERLELYSADALARLPGAMCGTLEDESGAAVMLYSPRTARIWSNLVRQAGLTSQASSVLYICLSKAVADQLRSSLQETLTIVVVDAPNDDAMLAALEKHTAAS